MSFDTICFPALRSLKDFMVIVHVISSPITLFVKISIQKDTDILWDRMYGYYEDRVAMISLWADVHHLPLILLPLSRLLDWFWRFKRMMLSSARVLL